MVDGRRVTLKRGVETNLPHHVSGAGGETSESLLNLCYYSADRRLEVAPNPFSILVRRQFLQIKKTQINPVY